VEDRRLIGHARILVQLFEERHHPGTQSIFTLTCPRRVAHSRQWALGDS
jgi:hypothetical protein